MNQHVVTEHIGAEDLTKLSRFWPAYRSVQDLRSRKITDAAKFEGWERNGLPEVGQDSPYSERPVKAGESSMASIEDDGVQFRKRTVQLFRKYLN